MLHARFSYGVQKNIYLQTDKWPITQDPFGEANNIFSAFFLSQVSRGSIDW